MSNSAELSIFIDESGDFGEYESHAPLYLMTLVFHDQSKDISEQVEHLKTRVVEAGFPREHAIHAGPLIRREKDYAHLDMPVRKKLFRRLFDFARICDIKYKTFVFKKREFKDHDALVSRMSRELSAFVRDNLELFQSYDKLIVYYDNGQKEITTRDCGGNLGPKRNQEESRMFSTEQRRVAIETFIKFDHSYADAVAELGYPNRHTLRNWWKEYEKTGEALVGKFERGPKYSDEQKREAVEHYLSHGKRLTRTMKMLGYPGSRQTLGEWVDELAPGERKRRGPNLKRGPVPIEKKVQVVAELEARTGPAAEIAERHGVSRTAPYIWRREIMGDNVGDTEEKGVPVSKEFDGLPDDVGELQDMLREAKMQLRKVQLELDVRQATLEIVKKDPGADPDLLTSAEKAAMVTALRPKYKLCEILPVVGMAKSSYEYARNAQMRGETEEHAAARKAVIAAFDASGGTYGYRRITAVVDVGEWTVRDIMKDEGLVACAAKKRRRYSSYEGEVSEAPPNLLRDERGKRHFGAEKPNELWITDVTEFRIPAGKVYLSPILDCFDGMPLSWSISTSPDAEMANSSLLGACEQLDDGDHPKIHSDRGGHYRWPGWIKICDEHGLVRSMSRKGCSPDNARCEGFFGRLKIEFFYGCDWSGITVDEFIVMLDSYLRWYREARVKSDLGYRSPMQYRRELGLAA